MDLDSGVWPELQGIPKPPYRRRKPRRSKAAIVDVLECGLCGKRKRAGGPSPSLLIVSCGDSEKTARIYDGFLVAVLSVPHIGIITHLAVKRHPRNGIILAVPVCGA